MELQLDVNKRYTYADYLNWMDDKMRELIHGAVKMMSPAPSLSHAQVSYKLGWQLGLAIEKNKGNCQVFTAPFDVRLPRCGDTADDKIDTVVQPDICVVCDSAKLDHRGCLGAPDMIVEILSPSSLRRDTVEKLALYEESGVKEYWIVQPRERGVTVFLLQENGMYDAGTPYEWTGKVPVYIFNNWEIDLNSIFGLCSPTGSPV